MEESSAPIPLPPKPARKVAILIIKLAAALAVVLTVWGVLNALVLPGVQSALDATNRVRCSNNLRLVGSALLLYESANGAFPPAAYTDDLGNPTISWRVAILPYLEYSDTYRAFDPKQPWDRPKNRSFANVPLSRFNCPSDPRPSWYSADANYVRIVGKDTVGGMRNEAVKLSDITDGPANTIMVVEVSGLNIHWAEPRDVTVEEFMEIVARSATQGRRSPHPGGFNAVMADGTVHFIKNTINPEKRSKAQIDRLAEVMK